MSAIASFIKLPKTALAGLREAALPKKRLFGAPQDLFHDYLDQHGQEVVEYGPSGYILATLLVYLQERYQIDLMKSEHDELSNFLCETRAATIFFFTGTQRTMYSDRLVGDFSIQEMCDYFNKFNLPNEPEIGEAMLDGVRAFKESLDEVDEGSVIFFSAG